LLLLFAVPFPVHESFVLPIELLQIYNNKKLEEKERTNEFRYYMIDYQLNQYSFF